MADYFNGAVYNATPNNTGVTVQTTNTLLLAANANRQGLIVVNSGSNAVYLAMGSNATATVGTGIYLGPSGGSFQFDANYKWQGAIYAIASGGTSVVTISEL